MRKPDSSVPKPSPAEADAAAIPPKSQKPRKEIPGNFTYTTAHGALKRALEGIITAERPDKLASDFLATVLKVTGGSARPIPVILKRMGFLTSDGSPTDLYSKFKSDSARSAAALDGLKKAFPEIFRRNDFAHRASREEIINLVVEITGLAKKDPVIGAIVGTFESIRGFVNKDQINSAEDQSVAPQEISPPRSNSQTSSGSDISLSYNINIYLPETTNIQVFNSIFASLKANLLG